MSDELRQIKASMDSVQAENIQTTIQLNENLKHLAENNQKLTERKVKEMQLIAEKKGPGEEVESQKKLT